LPNNIAVSITADVADLTAKRAVASAELKALQKDLNDLAQTARTSGMTDALKTQLMAAGDASAKASNEVRRLTSELKQFIPAAGGAHAGSAGVTRELIVMAREASRGNFSRLAGSATILAGRLNVLTPAVLGAGAAFGAIVGPLAIFLLAAEQGSEQLAKFQNAMEATGGYAGVTFSQLQVMAKGLADWAHEGVGAATAELMKLAASGRFTGQTIALIGADATRMSQLTGESADSFNAQFEKMGDGVAKFAADYQAKYHQLTAAQFAYIQHLEQQGQTEQAEYQLAKDVYDYLGNKAPEQLGTLESAWRKLTTAASDYWASLQAVGRNTPQDKINAAEADIARIEGSRPGFGGSNRDADLTAARQRLAAAQAEKAAKDGIAAAEGAAAAKQTQGVAAAKDLAEQFENSKTSGEKLAAAIAKINDELAKAKAADPGNAALYEKEAAAARAQAQKTDAPPKGEKAKDDSSEQWSAALEQQLADTKNAFADQAKLEQAFWANILAGTIKSGADRLKAQTEYNRATIAVEREKQEALEEADKGAIARDHDDPAALAADWRKYLADVSAVYDADTAHYQAAAREKAAADQEAIDRANERATQLLTKQGAENVKDDQSQGKTADLAISGQESQVKDNQQDGVISAQQATSQLLALNQQREDNAKTTALNVLEEEISTQEAIKALHGQTETAIAAANEAEVSAYKNTRDQIAEAAQESANRRTQIEQQAAKSQEDAYKQAIGSIVNTVGSGFLGMAQGTETFGQIGLKVAEDFENDFVSAIEKQLTSFLAGEALKKSTIVASQATQTAATTAGVTARTAAEQTGAAQTLLTSLLTTEKTILNNAAAAAAAAYQAMAGIPVIGPGLGAAAAATTFVAVEAFGNLASASRGYDIGNENPLIQAHAREMVLPAYIAEPLRGMIAANSNNGGYTGFGNANGAAAGGRGGGAAGLDPRALRALGGQLGVNTSALRGVTRQARKAMGAMAR